jgi:signal recognition particle receptor subunit beta
VVDSQAARLADNKTAWSDLNQHLAKMGYRLPHFPTVIQFNKRDLPDALPVAELKTALNINAYPAFEAVAMKGQGVPETLQAAMKMVLADVQRKLTMQAAQAKPAAR